MANQKLTELLELTELTIDDLLYTVNDPDGSPTAKKVSALNALAVDIGARIYHNASQNINNTTDTALSFNSETYDTHNFHDLVTNNSRLTIPAGMGGKYNLGIIYSIGGLASDKFVQTHFKLNGATKIAQSRSIAGVAEIHVPCLVVTYEFSAGDYIETYVYHDSGTTEAVSYAAPYSPYFWIQKVG